MEADPDAVLVRIKNRYAHSYDAAETAGYRYRVEPPLPRAAPPAIAGDAGGRFSGPRSFPTIANASKRRSSRTSWSWSPATTLEALRAQP